MGILPLGAVRMKVLVPVVLSGQNLHLLSLWLFFVQIQLDTATCECLCVCVVVWVSRKVSGTVLAPCDTTRTLRGKKVKLSPGSAFYTFIFSASENMTCDSSIVHFKCFHFCNIVKKKICISFIHKRWTGLNVNKKTGRGFCQNSVEGIRESPAFIDGSTSWRPVSTTMHWKKYFILFSVITISSLILLF